MRYPSEHKPKTREAILEAAASELRSVGIERANVADTMRRIGLTHGGFYRHFEGKDELIVAAASWALRHLSEDFLRLARDRPRGEALSLVIEHYLSERHVNHPERGCVIAALGSDLRRLPDRDRLQLQKSLDEYAGALQHLMPGRSASERRTQFDLLFSSLAGCVMAARVLTNRRRRLALLASAKRHFIDDFCRPESSHAQ